MKEPKSSTPSKTGEQSKVGAQPKAKAQPKTEAQPKAKAPAKAKAQPEAKGQPKAKAPAKAEAQPKAEAPAKAETQSVMQRQIAELKLQLADRDRRLSALTEQSLQILDRLAEEREEHADTAELYGRLSSLQDLLSETRQRVRLASRSVLAKGLEDEASFEIVVWGVGAEHGSALDPLLAAVPQAPVTLLLGAGVDPAEFTRDHPGGLSVQANQWRSSAYAWNESMAASQSDVVIVMVPGAAAQPEDLARLAAAAAADGLAIASPCLVSPQGRTLGRREEGLLEVSPQPTEEGTGVDEVPFPSPEIFAISRDAYHQLGQFDQDLAGDLALAEWALRARSQSLRCVGVRNAVVEVPALRLEDNEAGPVESDRLIVLSRHRPRQLAAAALSAKGLWDQEPMAVANVLRSVFQRLPNAGELSGAIDLLVVQAQTIAGWKRLSPLLRDQLVAMAGALGIETGELEGPGLVSLAEQIVGGIAELVPHAANKDAVQSLRNDIIARANTIDKLRSELNERERAIASLREEHGKRVGERDRLLDHVASQQMQLEVVQQQAQKQLQQQAEEQQSHTDALQSRIDALQSRIDERQGRIDEHQGRIKELEEQLHGESSNLQGVLGEIESYRMGNEQLREQRDSLRSERSSLQEQRIELESRAHELLLTLRQREGWIIRLLEEVQRPRWWKRALTPAEAEFLERMGLGPD